MTTNTNTNTNLTPQTTTKLCDYEPTHVWFSTHNGEYAMGATIALADREPTEEDGVYPRGWSELQGTVDGDGNWDWAGAGEPHDNRGNTVAKMTAWKE